MKIRVADALAFLEKLSRDEPAPVERSRAYTMPSKAGRCTYVDSDGLCQRISLGTYCREHRGRERTS